MPNHRLRERINRLRQSTKSDTDFNQKQQLTIIRQSDGFVYRVGVGAYLHGTPPHIHESSKLNSKEDNMRRHTEQLKAATHQKAQLAKVIPLVNQLIAKCPWNVVDESTICILANGKQIVVNIDTGEIQN